MRDTIDMACESKLIYRTNGLWWMDAGEPGDELKAFEALVRADEREACAKVCDEVDKESQSQWPRRFATMIRARGNT
jgi:hypothetical protein